MNRVLVLTLCLALAVVGAAAQEFDFTRAEDCKAWHAAHDVTSLEPSSEGLVINIGGGDPYIIGPARDYVPEQLLWMMVKLKSDQSGMAQMFYFDRGAAEEQSVRFPVSGGKWEEVRVPMPALGPKYRLRFDPPGSSGKVVLAKLSFAPRVSLREPVWPVATPVTPAASWKSVRSGETTLLHGPRVGEFVVRLGDKTMACGFSQAAICYVHGQQQKWINISAAKTSVTTSGAELIVMASITDPDGGAWRLEQRFAGAQRAGIIDVRTTVSVDAPRDVAFLPMVVLFPGLGSFGNTKTQALFPGLEYLDKDEPSSSEADIVGPGSKRQVPDSAKITIPMMTVVGDGAYVAMTWQMQPDIAALFDSPDRVFKSGAHVMGLLYPGSNGNDREEGKMMPYGPVAVAAGRPITVEASILAGRGTNAMEAVKEYVAMRALPELPKPGFDVQGYARLAAAGWLDSAIREGARFRHATPGQFNPQPAGDAAWMMEWLATVTGDAAQATRLRTAASEALLTVQPGSYNDSGVSHVRYPVGSLLFGHVAENVTQARAIGVSMLRRFEPDGTLIYRPGKTDYGKTHFAKDANGLTSQVVASVLEHATVCGDPALIQEGLRLLRAMDKFAGSAPRGAQTWECPLHTPDILASAHLVKAYVIGYELTGDEHLLEMARYWAWTGVPFVYLVNPVGRDVGPYATIAVYGATSWVAPNWMGLPVQWCGLVYADALYRLHKYDPAPHWKQLADGIVISGMQQTFPLGSDSRVGLLPDSYVLRAGIRQNPAINPGTVQAPATHYYGRPIYGFASCRRSGLFVHVPGRLSDLRESAKTVRFNVSGCVRKDASVLISGCKGRPAVQVNNQAADVQWLAENGCAVVKIPGDTAVQITMP